MVRATSPSGDEKAEEGLKTTRPTRDRWVHAEEGMERSQATAGRGEDAPSQGRKHMGTG